MGMVSRSYHQHKMFQAGITISNLEGRVTRLEHQLRLSKVEEGRLASELHAIGAGKTKVFSADRKGNPKVYLV